MNPAGKMLGGSGSHNDNIYNRGSPWDYDNFANITGDASWKYKNILKHFKRVENYVGELFVDEGSRSSKWSFGFLVVRRDFVWKLP